MGLVRWTFLLVLFLATMSAPLAAQNVPRMAGGWLSSRAELERELQLSEEAAQSPAYGDRSRARARARALGIRTRLAEGDFRPGDKIELSIVGAVSLSDTLTVRRDRGLDIPGIATVPLGGVLRTELEERVQDAVRTSVLDARVIVRTFVRLGVFGQVARPGYVLITPDATVDQLFTAVGGFVPDATPLRFSVMRADTVVLDAAEVREAIASRATLDALDIAEGDYFRADPRKVPFDRSTAIQLVGLLLTPILTLLVVR